MMDEYLNLSDKSLSERFASDETGTDFAQREFRNTHNSRILLFPKFWNAATISGRDNQSGTLIHEMSHDPYNSYPTEDSWFPGLLGQPPTRVVTPTQAARVARGQTADVPALSSAINFEYFIMQTPLDHD
jgi:hypothetical protein